MSKKTLLALGCAALLGTAAFPGDESKPACCATKTAKTQGAEKMRCSLTGKVVPKCCCVEKAGRLHCTLADKDVASCCCSPAKQDEARQAK